MKLHEDERLFRQAIQATADRLQIRAVYVEKDYWVTLALKDIFSSEVGEDVVFKGGTALSKCFNLIERFSEDIDLVLLRRKGESDSKMKTKLRKVSTRVNEKIPEVAIEGVTNKMGMNRKTAHTYEKVFEEDYGQVRDVIVLESSWLGHFEPFEESEVSSYITQMMLAAGQEDMVTKYSLEPFPVKVLSPQRTICEKIMSLVRFSYEDNPIDVLKMKVRHTYDLHRLLTQPALKEFFDSEEFDKMLNRVARDDVKSFKNNKDWLEHHPSDALFFNHLEREVWSGVVVAYNGAFAAMVYGELPPDNEVLATLVKIKNRIAEVEWKVELGEDPNS